MTDLRVKRNSGLGIFAGVCAGLSDYWGLNVIFVRILFMLSFFCLGFGIPLYIILSIILPSDGSYSRGWF